MGWEVSKLALGQAGAPDDFEKIRREPSSLSHSLDQEYSIGVSYDPRSTVLEIWFGLVIGLGLSLGRRLGLVVD